MIEKLRSLGDRHTISKLICGGLVAAALVLIPLPTLADESSPTQTPATTSSVAPNPATDKPADTSLQAAPVDSAGTLDTPKPSSSPTPTAVPTQSTAQTADTPTATSSKPSSNQTPKASIDTTVKANANSGDATVKDNRTGGDATSGNSQASATNINVANANGMTAGNFQTFNCDIRDDIQGNVVIDPTTLMPYCSNTPASPNANTSQGGNGSLQTSAGLADILNNIVLSAGSGDATVSGNRTGGDATSGNATALANVVNIANSAISAKNSFVGVINIYSNVQGDILVPQSIVDGLAAHGAIPTSGQTSVSNNLDASATSGNATVKDNRTGGDATSGNAATSMTVMNLTGQQVVAKNSLLVFVNVLGKWMGMIVPAPGANTAMLGSGIQASQPARGTTQTGGSQSSITNNISVKAESGDASVTGNRTGGNATSGSAQAGINLLNITDSNFKLDDWFGALFINVLGNWLGNFDIQKLAEQPADGTPPISDIKVYQMQQEAPVQNLRPAKTAAKPAVASAPRITDEAQPALAANDLSDVSQTTGTVLGSSSKGDTVNQAGGFKIGLPLLAAIGIVLMLATAALTRIVRNRLAARGR